MWSSERRSRLIRAPSTPAKRKGKARVADSSTLNAAPIKVRPKGATRQVCFGVLYFDFANGLLWLFNFVDQDHARFKEKTG